MTGKIEGNYKPIHTVRCRPADYPFSSLLNGNGVLCACGKRRVKLCMQSEIACGLDH